MTRTLTAAICLTLTLPGGAALASTFDIVTGYVADGAIVSAGGDRTGASQAFSMRQRELLGVAETFWEGLLTGFSGMQRVSFALTAAMTPIDGSFGTVAFAGPRRAERVTGEDPTSGAPRTFVRATAGQMTFDADDFGAGASRPLSEQIFLDAAIHEVAHAIGFGTLFTHNDLIGGTDDRYFGAQAVAAFNTANGTAVESIPLQDGAAHWSECWIAEALGEACTPTDGSGRAGTTNDPEIMSAILPRSGATMSTATLGVFRDLGFLTVGPEIALSIPDAAAAAIAPVTLPASGVLLFFALGGLAIVGRRRGTKAISGTGHHDRRRTFA